MKHIKWNTVRKIAKIMAVVMLSTVFTAFSIVRGGDDASVIPARAETIYSYTAEDFKNTTNKHYKINGDNLVAFLGYSCYKIPNGITTINPGVFKYRIWEENAVYALYKYSNNIGDYSFTYVNRIYDSATDGSGTINNLPRDFEKGGGSSLSLRYQSSSSYSKRCSCSNLLSSIDLNAVVTIGADAFYGQYQLSEIVIPNTVETIGESAFQNCTRLSKVTLGNAVTEIGDYAFAGCTSLTDITIPASVKTIGAHAFDGCKNLKTVTLTSGLEIIRDHAFQDCSNLEEIIIPDTVEDLGEGSFYNCLKLKNVKLPANLVMIEPDMFYGCCRIDTIEIPKNVRIISSGAFAKCSIQTIYLPASLFTIEQGAFGNKKAETGWGLLDDVYYEGRSKKDITDGGTNNRIFNDLTTIWHYNNEYGDPTPTPTNIPTSVPSGSGESAGSGDPVPTVTPTPTPIPYFSDKDKEGGLYYDKLHTEVVGDDEITVYANGGKIKTDTGIQKNMAEYSIYTDIKASYWHKNARPSTGKVIVAVTTSETKPSIFNGKVKDTSAQYIASAKISSGYITIKAQKEPGTVYLHVMDTGEEETYACIRFEVKTSPSKIEVAKATGSGEDYEPLGKNETISVGQTITLKAVPKYKAGNGEYVELEDADIMMTVNDKYEKYFEIEEVSAGVYNITALKKVGKKMKANFTFSSIYNSKKTKISISVTN